MKKKWILMAIMSILGLFLAYRYFVSQPLPMSDTNNLGELADRTDTVLKNEVEELRAKLKENNERIGKYETQIAESKAKADAAIRRGKAKAEDNKVSPGSTAMSRDDIIRELNNRYR